MCNAHAEQAKGNEAANSLMSEHERTASCLFVAQCFDRVESRGATGGPNAEEEANTHAESRGQAYGLR